MKLDQSQKRFCDSLNSHVRLLAPAGSGKTLSLLYRCKNIYEANPEKPQKFLIFTFTRVARDELKQRIVSDNEFSDLRDKIRIETLNRWGYSYLKNQVKTPLALKSRNSDLFFLAKHNLRPILLKNYKRLAKKLDENPSKLKELMNVIDTLKACGFRHDSVNLIDEVEQQINWLEECGLSRYFEAKTIHYIQSLGLIKKEDNITADQLIYFMRFWKEACEHIWNSAIITLEDQKYWALVILQEKYANSYFPPPSRYHHIFVDEFQDINPLDLSLIRELVRVNQSSLTIVGDDDQAIFEWRGAVPKFILHPDKFFNASFETYTLETNYRSPSNIISYSQNLIKKNKNRVPKNVISINNSRAEISHYSFPSHSDALNFVLKLSQEANNLEKPKALAVLSRKKSQLIPLQIMLTSENINFYAKEDLNILLSQAFEDLKIILEASATKNERKSAKDIVKTFIRCCDKVKAYHLPKPISRPLFGYLLSTRPRNFMDCLNAFQKYTGKLRGDVLEYCLPIAKIMEASTVADAIETIESEMVGLQKHYAKGEDDIFYKDPPFLHLADYSRRYHDDFLSFIDDVEQAIATMTYIPEPEFENEAIDKDLNHSVHLMTALRAKGKEYETVVILDANDGMWPIRFAETDAELEQERRVFYVAITRAQKRLLFISVNTMAGNHLDVTPYLSEMGFK